MLWILAQAVDLVVTGGVVAIVTALVSGGIGTLTHRAITSSEGRITDRIGHVEKDITEIKDDLKTTMLEHAACKSLVDAHLRETPHAKKG